MKINVSYMGPEWLANLRRDFLLLFKYALEDLGHQVMLSTKQIELGYLNILIGSYFLEPKDMISILNTKARIVHVNTEIIKNGMLNHNPDKVDLENAYMPFLRAGLGIMDLVPENIPEYKPYDTEAHFLRWAYHEKLDELVHRPLNDKDLDFYFFGFITEKRQQKLDALAKAGFKGAVHHSCPYFERNSFIERTKVNLNLVQKDIYTHVNPIRIGYLSNNKCAILTEEENDPEGFLDRITVTNDEMFVADFADLIKNNKYQKQAEENYYWYRQRHITPIMEEVLDNILSKNKK